MNKKFIAFVVLSFSFLTASATSLPNPPTPTLSVTSYNQEVTEGLASSPIRLTWGYTGNTPANYKLVITRSGFDADNSSIYTSVTYSVGVSPNGATLTPSNFVTRDDATGVNKPSILSGTMTFQLYACLSATNCSAPVTKTYTVSSGNTYTSPTRPTINFYTVEDGITVPYGQSTPNLRVTVRSGQKATLRWNVTGSADTVCKIRQRSHGVSYTDYKTNLGLVGSMDTPNLTASTTYVLQCANSIGSTNSSSREVLVSSVAVPPTIESFLINGVMNPSLVAGQKATLTWNVIGTSDTMCRIRQTTQATSYSEYYRTNLSLVGSVDTPNLTQSSIYQLECTNSAGTRISDPRYVSLVWAETVGSTPSTPTLNITNTSGQEVTQGADTSAVTFNWAYTGSTVPSNYKVVITRVGLDNAGRSLNTTTTQPPVSSSVTNFSMTPAYFILKDDTTGQQGGISSGTITFQVSACLSDTNCSAPVMKTYTVNSATDASTVPTLSIINASSQEVTQGVNTSRIAIRWGYTGSAPSSYKLVISRSGVDAHNRSINSVTTYSSIRNTLTSFTMTPFTYAMVDDATGIQKPGLLSGTITFKLYACVSSVGCGSPITKTYVVSQPVSTLDNPFTEPRVLGAYTSNVSCVDVPRNMHRGAESSSVTTLQEFLIQKGFLTGPSTGFYGDKTVEAVKDYQASRDLPVTGMVYDVTRQTIKAETCTSI